MTFAANLPAHDYTPEPAPKHRADVPVDSPNGADHQAAAPTQCPACHRYVGRHRRVL